jgi:ribonuclease Z
MRPSFSPKLINPPFDDPGLFIALRFERRALLFDLGDLHSLAARDLLKVSDVFVTHAHMDHFIGFDRLLRANLGRGRCLRLYGPQGIHGHVAGRLAGYCWNLVSPETHPFTLEVTEVLADCRVTIRYSCGQGFSPAEGAQRQPFDGVLRDESGLTVRAVLLDHGIPCLGLALEERMHVNIRREALTELGIEPGPWLSTFKHALVSGLDRETLFRLPASSSAPRDGPRWLTLGELARRIALVAPGQKVVYITDVAWNAENVSRIVDLAREADLLFIEAAFLDRHRDLALARAHLTAHQAGLIAGWAGARHVTLFHHSPRYTGMAAALDCEAQKSMVLAREHAVPSTAHRQHSA